MSINDSEVSKGYVKVNHAFERYVGVSIEKFIDTLDAQNQKDISKCPKCKSKDLKWQSGFPGEELLICNKCNEIVASEMHWSEIE